MTTNAELWGLKFWFRVVAELRLPIPGKKEAIEMAKVIPSFIKNPSGVLTGQVELPDIGLKAGIVIEAETTLPFDLGHVYFFGDISLKIFHLKGNAKFGAGGFSFDCFLEFIAKKTQVQLEFGGAVKLGPFGQISVVGGFGLGEETYYHLNGSFCKPLMGSVYKGWVATDSRTGLWAFEMTQPLGFLGWVKYAGSLQQKERSVRVKASAEIDLQKLVDMIDELIDAIVTIFTGITDEEELENSVLGKILRVIMSPLTILVRAKVNLDLEVGTDDLPKGSVAFELTLNIAGKHKSFAFGLSTPSRRRMLSLANGNVSSPLSHPDFEEEFDWDQEFNARPGQNFSAWKPHDWPHPDDDSSHAHRRRALGVDACGNEVDDGDGFTLKGLLQKFKDFFNMKKLIRSMAPIDKKIEWDISWDLIPFKFEGE